MDRNARRRDPVGTSTLWLPDVWHRFFVTLLTAFVPGSLSRSRPSALRDVSWWPM